MTEPDDDVSDLLWPLCEIEVAGLFGAEGAFTLELDPTATILTGENGSGKSTILQAIHAIGLSQWNRFGLLPVGGMALRFMRGEEFWVWNSDGEVTLSANGEEWVAPRSSAAANRAYKQRLARVQQQMERATSSSEMRRLREEYANLRARLRDADLVRDTEAPPWVARLERDFQTKLISARRLEHRLRPDESRSGEGRARSVVDQFAESLAERMQRILSQYAGESRRQERSLPSQIVTAMQQAPQPSSEALANEVDALGDEVRSLAASLSRVGLLQGDDPEQHFADYPRDNASILLAIREVYRVTRQRLRRLTVFQSELELFADFLGERLSGKTVELNPRTGIEVKLDRGGNIRPSQLSSGEQQLLALGYELIFGTKKRSLVLLDEPELSLHVAWLQGLLSSFIDIGASRQLQFVVATHSPSVLAGFVERERSLDLLAS